MDGVADHDQELLEAYLDDDLSASQVQVVDGRLAREPHLAAALHVLRAERSVRAAVWSSLAPDQQAAERAVTRVSRGIRRHETLRRVYRGARIGGAVAAAVALFWGGWMVRGVATPRPARVAGPVPQPMGRMSIAAGEAAGAYRVVLTDETGNVIAVQRFSKLEDARQFADDLGRYQARRLEIQQGSAMLVSDHF